jgi:hypothetical protein
MRKLTLLFALVALPAIPQNQVAWYATTGDVSLNAAATAATIQAQSSNNGKINLVDQIVVYCSAACSATLSANGTAATATAGTITALLPAPLGTTVLLNFYTASNAGGGTQQGGVAHLGAGATAVLCLSPTCGNSTQVIIPGGLGTAANLTLSIGSMTGTVNITFYGRVQ